MCQKALSPGGEAALAVSATSVLGVLTRWNEIHPRLQAIAQCARRGEGRVSTSALSQAQLLAPIMFPGTIFCAGANYRDHVAEMSRALNLPAEPDPHDLGLKPWHFIKPSAMHPRDGCPHIAARVFQEGRLGGRNRSHHRPPLPQRQRRGGARLHRRRQHRQRFVGSRSFAARRCGAGFALPFRLGQSKIIRWLTLPFGPWIVRLSIRSRMSAI